MQVKKPFLPLRSVNAEHPEAAWRHETIEKGPRIGRRVREEPSCAGGPEDIMFSECVDVTGCHQVVFLGK